MLDGENMSMSDILSIFERLSKNTSLEQQEVSEKLELLSESAQKAFENRDSRVFRSYCSGKQLFSDGTDVFDYYR